MHTYVASYVYHNHVIVKWLFGPFTNTRTHIHTKIESRSDDPGYLGHLGHFLVGQVGHIRKLNYLAMI